MTNRSLRICLWLLIILYKIFQCHFHFRFDIDIKTLLFWNESLNIRHLCPAIICLSMRHILFFGQISYVSVFFCCKKSNFRIHIARSVILYVRSYWNSIVVRYCSFWRHKTSAIRYKIPEAELFPKRSACIYMVKTTMVSHHNWQCAVQKMQISILHV